MNSSTGAESVLADGRVLRHLVAAVFRVWAMIAMACACNVASASDAIVAIVIDDLGNRPELDNRIVALPAPVTVAILPFTPGARQLSLHARQQGKEVLLHLPMEAHHDNHLLGAGALHRSMDDQLLGSHVAEAIASVPNAIGINNHMGSAFSEDPSAMRSLMQAIHRHRSLFYLDSRTTGGSVARQAAAAAHVPYLERDVFLDDVDEPAAIAAEFDHLVRIARQRGYALAIGHPYPTTLALLERRLPTLAEQGIKVVGIFSYMNYVAVQPSGAANPATTLLDTAP
ncbi:MAG: divergent polysaccharide deacetylase family protein [Gammaproteobacteria bacterium]|nr:divergent polysaccharide deacetylase family protein [Gammaproteobacteria bacterium]